MPLPALSFDALQLVLIAYWILAISAIFMKNVSSKVSSSLTYGKLALSRARRHGALLDRPFARPVAAWPCFYAIGTLIACIACVATSNNAMIPTETSYVMYLFMLQAVRRFTECLLVHRHSEEIAVTFLQFLAGVSFYVAAPLSLLVRDGMRDRPAGMTSFTLSNFLITTVFLIASYAQNYAHRTLASVKPVVGKYGIPTGFLFSMVTCPHYFMEVVIYGLFAIHVASLQSCLLLMFVFLNLTDSALGTHKWYRYTFPAEMLRYQARFAIIPFLL